VHTLITHSCSLLHVGESLFGVQAKTIYDMSTSEQNKLREDRECMPFLINVGVKYNHTKYHDAAKFAWKIMKINPESLTWKKTIVLPE
jgi:hypothetical protein